MPKTNKQEFYILNQLGSGATCRVFKAQHLGDGKIYAIKKLQRGGKRSPVAFRKEVEMLKKLHHPNIIAFHGCYVDDKCFYVKSLCCVVIG